MMIYCLTAKLNKNYRQETYKLEMNVVLFIGKVDATIKYWAGAVLQTMINGAIGGAEKQWYGAN